MTFTIENVPTLSLLKNTKADFLLENTKADLFYHENTLLTHPILILTVETTEIFGHNRLLCRVQTPGMYFTMVDRSEEDSCVDSGVGVQLDLHPEHTSLGQISHRQVD